MAVPSAVAYCTVTAWLLGADRLALKLNVVLVPLPLAAVTSAIDTVGAGTLLRMVPTAAVFAGSGALVAEVSLTRKVLVGAFSGLPRTSPVMVWRAAA